MKKLVTLSFVLLCLATFVWAQVWVYDSDFKKLSQPHSVVVDKEGKIWICTYAANDSIQTAEGVWKKVKALKVYNPDGSEVMSVKAGVFDGVADTLFNAARGMSTDVDGNILYVAYDEMFRFNYQTGEGMNKAVPKAGASLTEPACTDDGYIFVAHVAGGNPVWIYAPDFSLYSVAEDTNLGLQRSILVTGDGKHFYLGKIYSGCNGVVDYYGPDGVDGEYARVDTFGTVFNDTGAVVHNMWGQCLDWGPNGLMWVGTYWDVGVNDFTGWYALDPTQNWAIVDTIGHSLGKYVAGGPVGGGGFYSPRGISWTADGNTAYIADFDGGVVMKFTNAAPKGPGSTPIEIFPLGIREGDKLTIAFDFTLRQNYPNPFNPTTTIPFEIKSENLVKLTVYDMLGREVATLVNEKLTPGNYNFKFDASGLASGMYIYRLDVNGQQAAKNMMYIK